jgi:hypothetical protein
LRDIKSIVPVPHKYHGEDCCFAVVIAKGYGDANFEDIALEEKMVKFCCSNPFEMIEWLLTLDGLANENFHSNMDATEKVTY